MPRFIQKLLVSVVVPWAIDHVDEAVELVLPALVERIGLDEKAADIAVAVVPEVIRASQVIYAERPDLDTAAGSAMVVEQLRLTLDELGDDWPVLRDWSERQRDEYIGAIATTALYTLKLMRDAKGTGFKLRRRRLRRAIENDLLPRIRVQLQKVA